MESLARKKCSACKTARASTNAAINLGIGDISIQHLRTTSPNANSSHTFRKTLRKSAPNSSFSLNKLVPVARFYLPCTLSAMSSSQPETGMGEAIFYLVLLVGLLYLTHILNKNGLFDHISIETTTLPPLLVAVSPATSHPHRSELMEKTFDFAINKGVVEDYPDFLKEHIVGRGERFGVYHDSPHPFMEAKAEEGIILDTDRRVTADAIAPWEKRFSTMKDTKVSVDVLHPGECLTLTAPLRIGKLANYIMRWRVLRKLQKRCAKRGIVTNTVFYSVSIRRARVLAAVPLTAVKSD